MQAKYKFVESNKHLQKTDFLNINFVSNIIIYYVFLSYIIIYFIFYTQLIVIQL